MVKENKNINTEVTSKSISGSVGYNGTIKVNIVKKGKVLSSKSFKNSGRYPLFQFFAESLRGDYRTAEDHRPSSIVIFSVKDELIPTITDDTKDGIATYCNDNNRISYGQLTYKSVPEIVINSDVNLGSAAIKYVFNVPFTAIGDVTGNINLIGLYNAENRKDYTNPSAFFFVADESDPTKLGSLISGVDVDSDLSNYSLIIEWTLKLGNSKSV